jgi:hypothetical protein
MVGCRARTVVLMAALCFSRVGPDAFAMVPFWDLANHGVQPNSDFRVDASGAMQLVAVKDIPADTEVLISYTGELLLSHDVC